jgi:hypothetical protein
MKSMKLVEALLGKSEKKQPAEEEAPIKATDLLKDQHGEVDGLFLRIERAAGSEKKELVTELAAKLVAHSTIEKEIFYPAVQAIDDEATLEAFEEHAHVEHALARLVGARISDGSYDAKVTVLKELVKHHVNEEESQILDKAESELEQRRLQALGRRMAMRFDEVVSGNWRDLLEASIREVAPRVRRRSRSAKRAA